MALFRFASHNPRGQIISQVTKYNKSNCEIFFIVHEKNKKMMKGVLLYCCAECDHKYQRIDRLENHYLSKHPNKTMPMFPSLTYKEIPENEKVCKMCLRKGECDHKN
jgi:hypothetical protein